MASPQIELPFTAWDILGAVVHQSASLASSVWAGLTPGYRLLLVAVLILGVLLPPTKATAPARRFHRRRRYRVSVFHNPGSLLGTVQPFVETHAVLSGEAPQFWMMRVYVSEHEHPEYVCLCRLAEACGINLE